MSVSLYSYKNEFNVDFIESEIGKNFPWVFFTYITNQNIFRELLNFLMSGEIIKLDLKIIKNLMDKFFIGINRKEKIYADIKLLITIIITLLLKNSSRIKPKKMKYEEFIDKYKSTPQYPESYLDYIYYIDLCSSFSKSKQVIITITFGFETSKKAIFGSQSKPNIKKMDDFFHVYTNITKDQRKVFKIDEYKSLLIEKGLITEQKESYPIEEKRNETKLSLKISRKRKVTSSFNCNNKKISTEKSVEYKFSLTNEKSEKDSNDSSSSEDYDFEKKSDDSWILDSYDFERNFGDSFLYPNCYAESYDFEKHLNFLNENFISDDIYDFELD